MYCLIYLSHELTDFNEESLKNLAEQAAAKNDSLEITGYLYYHRQRFVQYLEGPEENIVNIFDTIRNDSRHRIDHSIESNIDARRFPSWSMQKLVSPVLEITMETILKNHMMVLMNLAQKGMGDISKSTDNITWDMVHRLSRSRKKLDQLRRT